jgi:hypothetical protein
VKRSILAVVVFLGLVPAVALAAPAPTEVRIAIQIDQVTDINQKAENFTLVGNFLMGWKDSAFAFDPAECGCEEKTLNAGQFEDFAKKNSLIWPNFLFYNQQGNRWIQERIFQVRFDGEIGYVERFTVTLQAPDFNFLKYPFDTQQFKVRVVSLRQEHVYVLAVDQDYTQIGKKLGEEEWLIGDFDTSIDSVTIGPRGSNSRFTFSFPARRHVDYYVYRIFLPLFLIILVAYATFFMKDYGKRVDYSAANLLTFVMFNFAIGSDLPRLGYLTFVDSILVMGFVITAVTVIANVIQKRLAVSDKEEVARRWDGMILWGYPLLYLLGGVWSYFHYFG